MSGSRPDNANEPSRTLEGLQAALAESQQRLEIERLAREAAERTSELKDELIARLSHDLRTPLGAILGWTHVLAQSALGREELLKGIATIERNARVQVQLLDELLASTRTPSGKGNGGEGEAIEGPENLGDADLTGIQVLVVDDDPDSCDIVSRILSAQHAQVLSSRSGAGALYMLEHHRPHVLISDIGMPDMDGYELLVRVRLWEKRSGTRLPAVALTAHVSPEDRMRALQSGFADHIGKPIVADELVSVVARYADRSRL